MNAWQLNARLQQIVNTQVVSATLAIDQLQSLHSLKMCLQLKFRTLTYAAVLAACN